MKPILTPRQARAPTERSTAAVSRTLAFLGFLGAWCGSSSVAAASHAPVEEGAFELRWQAPAMCPDRRAASDALRAQLRGLPQEGSADVVITEDPRGFAATIVIAGDAPFASRDLVAGDCDALARASVLVIAVAIDPVAVVGAVDPTDGAIPPPVATGGVVDDAPRVRVDVVPRTAATSAPRRASPWSHRVRVGGGVGNQAVGAIHGAAQLGYAAVRDPVRVELLATWGSPRTLRYADGAGVRVQSLGIAARGCLEPKVGRSANPSANRLSLPVCLGLEGGPSFGRGRDVPRPTGAINGWLAAELGVAAIVRVHPRVGLVIAADAHVALLRPAFHLGVRSEIVDAPQVGARGLLGLELRLR